jgi:hypothetical protein
MKKKTLGDLLAPCIHCCKLKDKGGAQQGKLLQTKNNEGDRSYATLPKVLVSFVPTQKGAMMPLP